MWLFLYFIALFSLLLLAKHLDNKLKQIKEERTNLKKEFLTIAQDNESKESSILNTQDTDESKSENDSPEVDEVYDLVRQIEDLKYEKEYLQKDVREMWEKYKEAESDWFSIQAKIVKSRQQLKFLPVQHYINKDKDAVVGIDFEYLLQGRLDTPCQVGLVKIVDNVIVLRYSTLIHVSSTIEGELSYGNGITREMAYKAPWFSEVIKVIESICKGATIVAHNKSTEINVLKKTCELHKIESWLTKAKIEDTCKLMGGKGLQVCCEEYNIPLKHHDALSDAEACARLYLISQGKSVVEEHVRIFAPYAKETITSDVYKPLPNDQVENKNTPFFGGVKTVVSGTFENFPDRGKLKELLQSLGADVDTTVTKRTQIFVAGKDCGLKKMEKVEAYGIRIINEKELLTYIKQV